MDTPETTTDLPVHDIDGQPRVMGCLPPELHKTRRFASILLAVALIARSLWREVNLEAFLGAVWNQGNHGSCVGHGGTKAYEVRYRLEGKTVPPSGFSPTSLYALCNGGRDGGAIVADAMDALINGGLCTMDEVPESVIYARQISATANATRKRFRAEDAYHCSTFDQIVTALQLSYPVAFGITIYSAFNSPPANGIIPRHGFVLGGHCMCAFGVTKIDGKWYLRVRNSWGEAWGLQGNCLLGEEWFANGDCDAFALRVTRPDPQDPNNIPVAA